LPSESIWIYKRESVEGRLSKDLSPLKRESLFPKELTRPAPSPSNPLKAKSHLQSRISHFIRDRIEFAGKVIHSNASTKIRDGDVVLTYGRSSVVEGTLLKAWENGRKFSVIVVDGRPGLEGEFDMFPRWNPSCFLSIHNSSIHSLTPILDLPQVKSS